jgi:hypothetical protein
LEIQTHENALWGGELAKQLIRNANYLTTNWQSHSWNEFTRDFRL